MTAPEALNRCREEFEHWCVKQGLNTDRHKEDGRYERQDTRGAWSAWRFFWTEQCEMRLLNDALPAEVKYAIADEITIEARSKADVVQDVWDELVSRGLVREPKQ